MGNGRVFEAETLIVVDMQAGFVTGSDAVTVPHELRTDRLWLRGWLPADLAPFATLNADPRVIEYLPGLLSQAESNALVARIETHFDEYGFGLWAVEIHHAASFAGFIGLSVLHFKSHFTPCVEIGWRLGTEHWSHGYATAAFFDLF